MPDITNVPNVPLRVTERIRKFLWQFPNSSPKEVCRVLNLDYRKYRNMVTVEKSHLKRWRGTKVLGRLLKPLVSAHRVEWSFEKPMDMVTLCVLSGKAGKRRPRLSDPRPVDEWYVVPNRNGMREFHNEFVTVRVFPKSGTIRALAATDMDFEIFRRHVKIAFLKGGLSDEQAEAKSRQLMPSEKHRTFKIGPVTPFKIDFYKDPLGLTIKADGSHPCLTPGSLIVTKNGLTKIEDVQEGEEVLTHKGRYRPVLQVMSRDYDGIVITIKPRYGLPCTLTTEHPAYAAVKGCTDPRSNQRSVRARDLTWISAGSLKEGDLTSFPLIDTHAIPVKAFCSRRFNQHKSSREEIKLLPDVLRLIGYYLGDGSRTGHAETKIILGKNQEDEAQDIKQIVKRYLHRSVRVTDEENMLCVVFAHAPFQRYLSKVYGTSAFQKHLPHFFLNLSKEGKIEFLKGIFRSDGSRGVYTGYLRYCFVTSSPDLAIKTLQIMLSLGIFASISERNEVGRERASTKLHNVIITRHPFYFLNVNGLSAVKLAHYFNDPLPKTRNTYSFAFGFISRKPEVALEPGQRYRHHLKRYALTPIHQIRRGNYYGKVFNLKVQDDDSYCLPYLTVHNCHIETVEGWPSWVKPVLESQVRQTQSQERQTEAITALTEQIRVHLNVMKGISEASRDLKGSVQDLKTSTDLLRKTMSKFDTIKPSKEEKCKPFSLKEWLKEVHDREEST